MKRLHLTALVLPLVCAGVAEAADPPKIAYTGDGSDLQAVYRSLTSMPAL